MTCEAHHWFVVGADGVIGSELMRRCTDAGISVLGTTRRCDSHTSDIFLDLATDPSGWTIPEGIDVAFLCAAITSIDHCERKPDETSRVNIANTLALAQTLRSRSVHVIFLSTNQVFDGNKPRSSSSSSCCPTTEYGRQKAAVEHDLLVAGGVTIVRFTKVVDTRMKLLHSWVSALRQHKVITPFNDMVMSPVPLSFACAVLQYVGERQPGGIVQVSGERDMTYAEVAFRLALRLGVSTTFVQPVSCESVGIRRDAAPANTTLDTSRLAELGFHSPPVQQTIDSIIEGIIHE